MPPESKRQVHTRQTPKQVRFQSLISKLEKKFLKSIPSMFYPIIQSMKSSAGMTDLDDAAIDGIIEQIESAIKYVRGE